MSKTRMGLTPTEKRKWVEALVSGTYQQGRGRLETRDGRFCCLGVARKAILTVAARCSEASDAIFLERGSGIHYKKVVIPGTIQGALADLNDDGVPFDLIAGLVIDPWNGKD